MKATSLDGIQVTPKLRLLVKVSDPAHRQQRQGALYEGREVYVQNVDWSATEVEISELFSQYGSVERVRLPRHLDGKSKGIAFVVFVEKVGILSLLAL